MNGNGNSLNNEKWYQQPQAYCFHHLLERQADRNPEAIVIAASGCALGADYVLSQQLREANDRVADLPRTRPRELHKLFDKFD